MSDVPVSVSQAAPTPPRAAGSAHLGKSAVAVVALTAATVTFPWYAAWVLPIWVEEGPFVQNTTETSAVLSWWTSRPAAVELAVSIDGQRFETVPINFDGRRGQAEISGLEPGREYDYLLTIGRRTLVRSRFFTNLPADRPCSFIVFGDSGKAHREQYLLAQQMLDIFLDESRKLDFILHTGDVVYPDGERHLYKNRFFGPYRNLIETIPLFPCIGNHDLPAVDTYRDIFVLPENGPPSAPAEDNYWLDYGPVRIAALNTEVSEQEMADVQAPWLRDVLSAPGPIWRFVLLHRPPYTAGKYQDNVSIKRTLVPIFEQTGVDVVFAGHDHNYQHLAPPPTIVDASPVRYVINGAGGHVLYEREQQAPEYLLAINDDVHSFGYATATSRVLRYQQIDLHGNVLDEWTLFKNADPTADDAETEPAPTTTADAP